MKVSPALKRLILADLELSRPHLLSRYPLLSPGRFRLVCIPIMIDGVIDTIVYNQREARYQELIVSVGKGSASWAPGYSMAKYSAYYAPDRIIRVSIPLPRRRWTIPDPKRMAS